MKKSFGTTGLILNEPLLWEKGAKGRTGFSLPRQEVDAAPLDDELIGDGPDFPDLSEVGCDTPLYQAFPVEFWRGHRYVPPGFLHHEVQSENQ